MEEVLTPDTSPLNKADLRHGLHGIHSAVQAEIRAATKDILDHVGKGFSKVNQELTEMNTKLEAIMSGEVLVSKEQLLLLIDQLKERGIEVNTSRLFASTKPS